MKSGVRSNLEKSTGFPVVAGAILIPALLLALLVLACSVEDEGAAGVAGGGSGGSGGAGGVAPASADAAGGGRGGSSAPVARNPDAGGRTDVAAGAACEPRTSFTLAIHIIVNVSWEGTLGTNPGSGPFHLWNLARMTANGTTLTGMTQPCGNQLPPLTLRPLVGGGMAVVEVPDAVWDLPTAPKYATTGTLAGWTQGSALMTTPTIALVGLTMPDPEAAWPASYTMITPVDVEGDGNPGVTGIPRMAPGFVLTPVSTPIAGFGARADKLFLASRTAIGLNGTLTSCTEQSGTVTVKFFDNHVVGCHVSGGSDCTPAQINFVDTNRTAWTVASGTFTSRIVPDNATCADARAM